ncbi:MAG: hypothetical protein J5517_02275 [Eubacterium sp.]|nr:hypothetical protein [Eubacterium sp.]
MKIKTNIRKSFNVTVAFLMVLAMTFGTGIPSFAASKKTVYVISSITVKTTNSYNKKTVKDTYTFKYNKNGLIKKVNMKSSDKSPENVYYAKYTYKGKKIKKAYIQQGDGAPTDYKYTWKKGKITKADDKANHSYFMYNYENGRISEYHSSYGYNVSIVYDEQGRLIRNGKSVYEYDGNGFIAQSKEYSSTITFDNTVKGGRVTKIKMKSNYNSGTITIKYKKIKVSSGYNKLVEKQRNYMLLTHCYKVSTYAIPLGSM